MRYEEGEASVDAAQRFGKASTVVVVDYLVGDIRRRVGWFGARRDGDFVVARPNWGTKQLSCDIYHS
jgi:hypothetical protein